MSNAKRPYKRRIVLIRPAMQMRMIAPFVAICAVAVLLSLVTANLRDGPAMTLAIVIAVAMGVLLPLAVGTGILVTFRVAGPVHRFEQHLGAIARGEDPGVCKIRKTDELHGLCDAINAAVDRLREDARAAQEAVAPPRADAAPAQEPVESLA